MFRSISLLMIIVFMFTLTTSAFSQLTARPLYYSALADGKSDAEMFMDSREKQKWFCIGAGTILIGIPLATVVGWGIGSAIDSPSNSGGLYLGPFPSGGQCLGVGIGVAATLISLPLTVRNIAVEPSPEHLIGKTPEYVEAYTEKYKETVKAIRSSSATWGCITGGCLLAGGLYLYLKSLGLGL